MHVAKLKRGMRLPRKFHRKVLQSTVVAWRWRDSTSLKVGDKVFPECGDSDVVVGHKDYFLLFLKICVYEIFILFMCVSVYLYAHMCVGILGVQKSLAGSLELEFRHL